MRGDSYFGIMETTIYYPPKTLNKENKAEQANWQRLVLLIVLSYEAVGCLLGGSFLVAAPDGSFDAAEIQDT